MATCITGTGSAQQRIAFNVLPLPSVNATFRKSLVVFHFSVSIDSNTAVVAFCLRDSNITSVTYAENWYTIYRCTLLRIFSKRNTDVTFASIATH